MTREDHDCFVIDQEEVPTCIKLFNRNCAAMHIVKQGFCFNTCTSEEMFYIVGEYKNGEKEMFRFVLDYNEEEKVVELTMYDDYYDEIDCEEIHFARS